MENKSQFAAATLKELEAEATASRKCLERIPENLFDWQPHEKSMKLGYLALLVAEIPKWITTMINEEELDFGTFKHFEPKTTAELVKHFDENLAAAKKALQNLSDADLKKTFALKNQGQVVSEGTKLTMLEPTINHLVHHRGQLTVFMRLQDIKVPSIYGPSADDRNFWVEHWHGDKEVRTLVPENWQNLIKERRLPEVGKARAAAKMNDNGTVTVNLKISGVVQDQKLSRAFLRPTWNSIP